MEWWVPEAGDGGPRVGKEGRNGEMLVKGYKLPVTRLINSRDLMYSMMIIANSRDIMYSMMIIANILKSY